MSIRPVDFNGMIQRTQDVSTLKQNEDNRPVVEQQTIFSQEMKKVEQNLHQVVHAQEKENAGYRNYFTSGWMCFYDWKFFHQRKIILFRVE